MRLRKDQRDINLINDVKTRIETMTRWLNPDEKKPAPKEKPMTKAQFEALIKITMGDTGKPKAAIHIKDRKTVDRMWKWLKTANVLISSPPDVKQYFISKLKAERKTQL
jgi:hypothetical protein